METESRGLPTSLCLWLRNGRKWPPVLHPLAGAYCRTILLVHWCLERWLGAGTCAYMAPLGIEHFFDAFCFNPQRPWGAAAIQALGIPSCRVSKGAYLENMQRSTFSLTPRRIPTERKASSAKREVDQDMVAKEERVSEVDSDADSGWSGVSDNSSTDSECTDMEASSIASDQDRFDTAYEALQDLANDLYYIDLTRYSRGSTSEDAAGVLLVDGYEKLQEMVHLPRTWPLARLTIPLEGLSKQIDRLLEGYCFQILATNQYPEAHNGKVLQTATHLTWILAEYLSDTNKEQEGKRKYHAGTPHPNDRGGFPQWFGSCSLMTTLHVWFPACWAPMVAERLFPWSPPEWESTYAHEGRPVSGPPIQLPQHLLGTNTVRVLLAPTSQWRIATALKWSTRSDNALCLELQWCRCSMWVVVSSGWSWMIKLCWIAMGCCRRAFSAMCFRRNVLLLGKAHVVNDLQWASCCQAAKMRMTGSTSCYWGGPCWRG